ncbi:MAG: hypothetical protein AAF750_10470 [Planctomycetota bacterium]
MADVYPEAEILNARLRADTGPLRNDFFVSRKGCGKGSGDAPRAIKAIALSRLAGANGFIKHVKGDLYQLEVAYQKINFVFRTTTSLDVRRRQSPWFNVSSREAAMWIDANVQVVVLHVTGDPATDSYEFRTFVVPPKLFGDIEKHEVKESESVPSALFEVEYNTTTAPILVNRVAKQRPSSAIPLATAEPIVLSGEEAKFLTEGYSVEVIEDPSVGGRFEGLEVLIDPGTASDQEVAGVLSRISHIYELMGGSGVSFTLADARNLAGVEA